jgi:hypothetical protein
LKRDKMLGKFFVCLRLCATVGAGISKYYNLTIRAHNVCQYGKLVIFLILFLVFSVSENWCSQWVRTKPKMAEIDVTLTSSATTLSKRPTKVFNP